MLPEKDEATAFADDETTAFAPPESYTPSTLVYTYRSVKCDECPEYVWYHIETPISLKQNVNLQYRVDLKGQLVGLGLPLDMTFIGNIDSDKYFWYSEFNRNHQLYTWYDDGDKPKNGQGLFKMYTKLADVGFPTSPEPTEEEMDKKVILVFGPIHPYTESFQIYYSGSSGKNDGVTNYNTIGLESDKWKVYTKPSQ